MKGFNFAILSDRFGGFLSVESKGFWKEDHHIDICNKFGFVHIEGRYIHCFSVQGKSGYYKGLWAEFVESVTCEQTRNT